MTASSNAIAVNLWDDYAEDDLDQQNTYAYVEHALGPDECKTLLEEMLPHIHAWAQQAGSPLTAALHFHDSATVYPHLVGTELEYCLYKRWQINFTRLSHENREALVNHLNTLGLSLGAHAVELITES